MSGGLFRISGIVLTVAAMSFAAAGAHAQTAEQKRHCSTKSGAGIEQRLAACTAVIDKTKSKPLKAAAYAIRGNAYRESGNTDAAVADYDEAVKLNPKDADSYFNRARIFRDRGEVNRAAQDFEMVLRHDKRNAEATIALAHIYYGKRDFVKAIDALDLAIKINASNALAYYNRGMAYRAKGEPDRAIPDF
ncbi:MAG: tetratricopeptide repeat protein, partial [Xanthobacteraceae bacterium]